MGRLLLCYALVREETRPKVREHLGGREIEKFVFIPGRLVNVVTRKDMPA